MDTTLTPAQQHAFDRLQRSFSLGHVFILNGAHGSGRSTVLRALHAAHGRALLSMRDALRALRDKGPWAIETSFEALHELGLRPKRGVLLAGPPGTGKTTLGRALAHRLKSKFFMIDGTFVAGTHGFYESVQRVFRAARENAPSVLFIDDGDVIFAGGQESGLYRYRARRE